MEIKIKSFILHFFILIHLTRQIYCLEPVPQIKVVGTQISKLNTEFIKKMVYTVNRFNATFNYLKIFWNFKKDFPVDLKVYTKVYVTTSTYQKGTLVLDEVTPVCEENKNRELLHNLFQVSENNLNRECIKKGIYVLENLVQYRFEVLVPDIELRGNYYRVDYRFASNDTVISAVTFYNEWGYLNTI